MTIPSFRNDLYFLSNMFPCEFSVNNETFNSSEQFYQSRKCIHDSELYNKVMSAKDGYECKRLLRGFKPNKFFNKIEVMRNALFYKFSKNGNLTVLLINTPDNKLVERNTWHDNFFGNCECKKCRNIPGQNHLGKLLKSLKYDYI